MAAHPIGTPVPGVSPNTGPLASASWLLERNLTSPEQRWYVEVALGTGDAPPDDDTGTLLRIELFSEEWGFWFRHADQVSWIRVTDLPFVHGRDDHALLRDTPALRTFGKLVRALERRFDVSFAPEHARIRTSLFGSEAAIRDWLTSW